MIEKDVQLEVPKGTKKVLLHSCCASCSCTIIERMSKSGVEFTVFFYNPNIHPQKEYVIRKDENKRFADKLGIPFIDADYDSDNWFERVKGLEWEPERGQRCTLCFDMRFERTALYAHENGVDTIASSMGISRWKNLEQVNGCGIRVVSRYPDLQYWSFNWRKQGAANRMLEIAKNEQFYQQEYCGCVYSLRDTNKWRMENGREPVKIGAKFYGQDD